MLYNSSSNTIRTSIKSDQLEIWFKNEIAELPDSIKGILSIVYQNKDEFIKWPEKCLLLWKGADRVPEQKGKLKYHHYPELIREVAKKYKIPLDSRPNGPAITAFLIADGKRPERYGSKNSWSIHHLYSGKFSYPNSTVKPLHAVKDKLHFTQSAGLVAVHPIIDALFDEVPAVSWYFRYLSFEKFMYDPMEIFSSDTDKFGFGKGNKNEIIYWGE